MKSMRISWTLPTVREQGGAITPTEIEAVEIELSADAGANFSPVGSFPSDTLETIVADLPFGDTYVVRGRAIDISAQAGQWTVTPFVVSDTSPPGALGIDVADV
jgi:hypothetical protein